MTVEAALLLLQLVSSSLQAQSPALLEAVRIHKGDAAEQARAELEKCEKASCPSLPQLSLLAGYLELSEGDAKGAAEQLSKVPAPKGLEAFHAYYLGEAKFYSRDYAGAAAALGTATKKAPASLLDRARARWGEALLIAGKPAEAIAPLEQAATESPTPELLFERAQARQLTGNLDGYGADLRAIYLRYPAHPYAEDAELRLTAKGQPKLQLTLDEHFQRARGFLDAGQPKNALEEVSSKEVEKLAKGASAGARLAYVKAQCLYALGLSDGAEAQVDKARKGQPFIAAEAMLLRAKKVMRTNDNAKARELMAEVDKKYTKQPAADEAGYFVGWLDLQGGRYEDAVKAFEQFDKRHPDSRKRDEAMWFKSLALIRSKQYAKAAAALDALVQTFPKTSLVPQARYWATRARQLAGAKKEEVQQGYASVIDEFPATFYGLLAQARVKELGAEPPAGFPQPPKTNDAAKLPEQLSLAQTLAQSGLFRDALEEVNQQASSMRTGDDALLFAHALQKLGEYGPAYAIGARLFWGAAFTQKQPEALALLYPRAFQKAVEDAAKAHGVDPFLVWAIMRRESAFRPEVSSPADARGLMQLIPPTAAQIGAELKQPLPSPDALYAPGVNVNYGAWYLAALVKRFAHPTLVAAAYNAGPNPALRWASDRGDLDLDLFVETIPFKETRGYVKQVVADYYLYHAFYGEPGKRPELSLKVPTPKKEGVNF